MNTGALVMQGSLDEYDVVHVVQTLGAARHASLLELRDDDDEIVGSMLFDKGQIAGAQADALSGFEAVRRLLKTPRPRRFYVFRAPAPEQTDRLGPVALVLAQVLAPSMPPAPEAVEVLFSASLAEVNLRDAAAAVSLGRVCVGVEMFGADGQRIGAVYLRGGRVLFASYLKVVGPEALKELLKPRSDGHFVVFRAADVGVGEPIAELFEVLHPRRPADGMVTALVQDPDLDALDDEETRIAAPAAPPRASDLRAEAGPETGTRSVARKSFPPPSEAPCGPSEAPAPPRFRHSEGPRARSAASGSIPLADLGYPAHPPAVPSDRRVVCVTSPRGGVGRTTVSINLAVALARRGLRTLLVDADANGVLPALNAAKGEYPGVADLLTDRAAFSDALLPTRVPDLSLLPSGELCARTFHHPGWPSLIDALSARFDVVLVDCAPQLYGATLSVLGSASHYLMVVAAEPSAARACEAFRTRLQAQLSKQPELAGVVLNMLDYQARASVESLGQLGESALAGAVFDIPIPRSAAFMEARARGAPLSVSETGALSSVAWVFEALASALLERLAVESQIAASHPLLR